MYGNLPQSVQDSLVELASYERHEVFINEHAPNQYEVFTQCWPPRGPGDFDIVVSIHGVDGLLAEEVAVAVSEAFTCGEYSTC